MVIYNLKPVWILKKSCLLFFLTVTACQSLPNKPVAKNEYQIINLESDFELFWDKARTKSFTVQLSLWDELVEKKHQDFYDSLVWSKTNHKDWELRKREKLSKYFELYKNIYPQIIKNFKSFPVLLEKQISKFRMTFPKAKFFLPIFSAPSVGNFNGRAGDLSKNPGSTVLAFGIDTIIEQKDDPEVLYAHELFHIYHVALLDLNEVKANNAKMTLPLWLEGLATYVSSALNPNASKSAVLLDTSLAMIEKDKMSLLASAFLEISEKNAWNAADLYPYQAWFGSGNERPFAGLPARCGYLLGWELVNIMRERFDLQTMVGWDVSEIHYHVITGLKEMQKKYQLKPVKQY